MIATTLFNVSNNIRWLGSGPRCGFYEIKLPDRQPARRSCRQGQPGDVRKPDAGLRPRDRKRRVPDPQRSGGGQFQLNIMMPVMGQTTLESIMLLARGTDAFVEFCANEMEANEEACVASVEKSLSMVTSLNPFIGYEKAAPSPRGIQVRQDDPRAVYRAKHPAS